MTFDMERARALCNQATFTATGNPIDETLKLLVDQAGMLPAALDRILELESEIKTQSVRAMHNAQQDAAAAEIQAGRIKGLEEALIEERANQHIKDAGRFAFVLSSETIDPYKLAREQLHSEGKI